VRLRAGVQWRSRLPIPPLGFFLCRGLFARAPCARQSSARVAFLKNSCLRHVCIWPYLALLISARGPDGSRAQVPGWRSGLWWVHVCFPSHWDLILKCARRLLRRLRPAPPR